MIVRSFLCSIAHYSNLSISFTRFTLSVGHRNQSLIGPVDLILVGPILGILIRDVFLSGLLGYSFSFTVLSLDLLPEKDPTWKRAKVESDYCV